MGYITLVVAGLAGVLVLVPLPPRPAHLFIAFALLIPARIQGVLWREFFRGRHAMSEMRYGPAEQHFRAFLEALHTTPRLRFAIFLGWSFYTWNAEAMVRNNIGACQVNSGRLDAAESELKAAWALDDQYPIPVFNLAILARARGQDDEAERLRATAARLGYRAATRDRLIAAGGRVLAAIEGRL